MKTRAYLNVSKKWGKNHNDSHPLFYLLYLNDINAVIGWPFVPYPN